MKNLEEQQLNADLGLSIEKTENKAKIEISMINMNNQLEDTAKQKDLMRMSQVTKRSFNDVTTLAAQSNAFNMTNMSPVRFNQSIKQKKKQKMGRKSPIESSINETGPKLEVTPKSSTVNCGEVVLKDIVGNDTKIQTGQIEIAGSPPPAISPVFKKKE